MCDSRACAERVMAKRAARAIGLVRDEEVEVQISLFSPHLFTAAFGATAILGQDGFVGRVGARRADSYTELPRSGRPSCGNRLIEFGLP
jgi:hypothetical protein